MGNKKIEIPYAFALCGDTECACVGACLRHIAYLQQVETAKVMTMVNPRFCAKDNTCAFTATLHRWFMPVGLPRCRSGCCPNSTINSCGS